MQLPHGALFSVHFPSPPIGSKLRDTGCAVVRLAYLAHSEEWTLHDVIPVQSIPASTASLLCATERYNLEIRKLALGIGIPAIPILLKTWPLWESKGEGLQHHSGLRSALHRALKQPITVLETATTNWLLDDVSSLMPVTHESAGLALRLTFASLAAWCQVSQVRFCRVVKGFSGS